MRVSYITGSLSRKGAGLAIACQNYIAHLIPKQFQFEVFGEWDSWYEADKHLWPQVKLHAYKPYLVPQVHFLRDLPLGLIQTPADILHLHGLWTHWAIDGFRWSKITKRSYIISAHGMLDPWALSKSGWKKKLALAIYERRHLAHAHALHAVSLPEMKDYTRLGLTSPIHFIPNGVDINPTPNLQTREKSILFMARIQEKKGILPLIEGWAASKAKQLGWKLQIAGWDEGGCELRARDLASKLGISEQIEWLGALQGDAKWSRLQKTGGFILPSFSEGLPMAVLEAWAHATPTLISSFCNLPEAFEKEASIPAEPDAVAITKALNQFFDLNNQQRAKLGMAGYAIAASEYSAEKTADRLAKLYSSLAVS